MASPLFLLAALPVAFIAYSPAAHLLPGAIRRGPASRRAIALTFDDGPDPICTPRVLDILDRHGAKATFFLVGERARVAREVVKAITGAGHDIGAHGFRHKNLWWCSPGKTGEEIRWGVEVLEDLTGRPVRDFRPPWGMVNLSVFPWLSRLGLRCVLWSIQPEGLRRRAPELQAAHVLKRVHPGAIVDLHDAPGLPGAPARTLAALPAMLKGLRQGGYALVPLSKLLEAGP
jgi:peptidoglycan/xylan/chitin deacetylase (PgdA/CDA1 family)